MNDDTDEYSEMNDHDVLSGENDVRINYDEEKIKG